MLTVDCGTLVDGIADEPRYDARVVIEDGRVAAVGPRDEVEAVGERVEHDVVIPGLVDAHVHLAGVRTMSPMDWAREDVATMTARATADLRRLLAAGFTSVRDVGSAAGLGLRTAVSEGVIPGPRIHTSGRAFSQTGGHGDSHFLPYEWSRSRAGLSEIVDGPDECRKGARRRIRDGVDCIKIMATGGVLSEKDAPDQSQYTAAEIRAFAEEAHRVGIPVAAHAQGAPGIKNALRNGVDTVEHGFYVDDEAIDLLLETDATFVPTLSIVHRIVAEGADHGMPEWGCGRPARPGARTSTPPDGSTRRASPSPSGRTSSAPTSSPTARTRSRPNCSSLRSASLRWRRYGRPRASPPAPSPATRSARSRRGATATSSRSAPIRSTTSRRSGTSRRCTGAVRWCGVGRSRTPAGSRITTRTA
nr:amidohydrolase family protein [Halomarina sp. PSR21]